MNAYNDKRQLIGKAVINPNYRYDFWSNFMTGNDIAVIQLDNNVIAGENKFSGNSIYDNPQPGDKVCYYGYKSHSQHCGRYQKTDQYGNHVSNLNMVVPGDSGGSVWIDGKGLIGYVSTTEKVDGVTIRMRASNHNKDFVSTVPNEKIDAMKNRDLAGSAIPHITDFLGSALTESYYPFKMSSS